MHLCIKEDDVVNVTIVEKLVEILESLQIVQKILEGLLVLLLLLY